MQRQDISANRDQDLLFEGRKMPRKLVALLMAVGILLIMVSLVQFAFYVHERKESAYRAEAPLPPEIAGMDLDSRMGYLGYHKKEWKVRDLIVIFCPAFFGVGYLVLGHSGGKLYLRIYRTHIEGCAGMHFLLNDIYIPMDQIVYTAACTINCRIAGLEPSVMVYTAYGRKITFYMNCKKATEANQILKE